MSENNNNVGAWVGGTIGVILGLSILLYLLRYVLYGYRHQEVNYLDTYSFFSK